MKNILGYYLMPHPPIIIPSVGRGEEEKIKSTTNACKSIGIEVKEIQPETIIIISPHGVMFSDAITISSENEISGSLEQFRAKNVKISKEIDIELTNEILKLANDNDISIVSVNNILLSRYKRKFELDHGAIIPLYFIENEYQNYRLVHITYGLLSDTDLFKFGMMIKEAVANLNRKVVIVASGDLSHRLTEDGPYPYSPKGKEFDNSLLNNLKNGDILGVFNMDKFVIEEAGECGLRSIFILLGAINNDFTGELLSYEGPFGVGYGVMKFTPKPGTKNYLLELEKSRMEQINVKSSHSDEYVKLARSSIDFYFKNDRLMDVPNNLSKEILNKKAGVFVSLHKFGNLRGCVGTFSPTTNSIAEEIISNAIEAAFQDPRFHPLRESELNDLDISVDVLTEPVKTTKADLDPKKYGVIVSQGRKRGLLLPDLEGVDTIDEQLEIACEKAGISSDSNYEILKFMVERHHEGGING